MTTQQKRLLLGVLGVSLAGMSVYKLATTEKGDFRRMCVASIYGAGAILSIYFKRKL